MQQNKVNTNKSFPGSPVRKVKQVKTIKNNQISSQPNTSASAAKNKKRRRTARAGRRARGVRGNPYLRSLLDPFTIRDVKVPEVSAFPSGTFTLTHDFTVTPGTDGFLALAFSPLVEGCHALGKPDVGDTGDWAWQAMANMPSASSVTSLYDYIRPVSAGMRVEFVGSTYQDQGYMVAGLIPRNRTVPVSMNAAMALHTATYSNVRDGLELLWRPMDNSDLEYRTVTEKGLQQSGSFPTWLTASGNLPVLFAGIDGASSEARFRVRLVVNFEGTPKNDMTDLVRATANDSPSPALWETALQYLTSRPVAHAIGGTTVGLLGQLVMQQNQRRMNGPLLPY